LRSFAIASTVRVSSANWAATLAMSVRFVMLCRILRRERNGARSGRGCAAILAWLRLDAWKMRSRRPLGGEAQSPVTPPLDRAASQPLATPAKARTSRTTSTSLRLVTPSLRLIGRARSRRVAAVSSGVTRCARPEEDVGDLGEGERIGHLHRALLGAASLHPRHRALGQVALRRGCRETFAYQRSPSAPTRSGISPVGTTLAVVFTNPFGRRSWASRIAIASATARSE